MSRWVLAFSVNTSRRGCSGVALPYSPHSLLHFPSLLPCRPCQLDWAESSSNFCASSRIHARSLNQFALPHCPIAPLFRVVPEKKKSNLNRHWIGNSRLFHLCSLSEGFEASRGRGDVIRIGDSEKHGLHTNSGQNWGGGGKGWWSTAASFYHSCRGHWGCPLSTV